MSNNTFNPGELPVGAADTLRNPLDEGGIRLPFAAPVVWWKNGDKKMKPLGGVEYFGGWAINAEELDSLQVASPEGFAEATWTGDENDYDVFAGRFIGFAPIVKRFRWNVSDTGKGSGHVQILGVAATWDAEAKQFLSYGPVVISGKGFTSKYIQEALKEFERVTASARKEHASNLPANFFYAPLGSFGTEPNVVMVGKGENQSPITPPTLKPVEAYTPAVFQAFYLGADTIKMAIEWKEQAAEWVAAWKSDGKNSNGKDTSPGGTYDTSAPANGDIPF